MTSPSRPKRKYEMLDDKGISGKKRKRKISASEDEDSRGTLSSKSCNGPPLSKIYNSSFRNNKPAELFRKDLISAMKLPDNEQLYPDDYWIISDSWKLEWERGVQVPVNPDSIPASNIKFRDRYPRKREKGDFKMPKKYIKCTADKFSNEWHVMSEAVVNAERICRYDLDDLDIEWLKILNEERENYGLYPVDETTVELIIEKLETDSFDNLQNAKKREGIEFDEDVICDVCRSPDTEEGNEMVFCDSCNICVHQACYGITTIPEGSWLCCTCALGVEPSCLLCPNKGGAMKSTRNGLKWAHVSCALWIPEVIIGCVEKMEPITKISMIPASRWSLVCSLCKEKDGACIQCSVKTCKIAYHVTCAFMNGLEMKAIIGDTEEDGIKLKSFCRKHSKQKDLSDTESESSPKKHNRKTKKELNMSSGERKSKYKSDTSEFFNGISINNITEFLKVDKIIVDFVYQYWKLKRKANFNRPLLMPKIEEINSIGRNEKDYARMKMFVHWRQDLERVRNLCYMVGRREKLFRSWCRIKEEIFHKQLLMMTENCSLNEQEKLVILHANHGDSIYDSIYTCNTEIIPSLSDSILILESKPNNEIELTNKFEKEKLHRLSNPYAKQYLNGIHNRVQRRLTNLTFDNSNKKNRKTKLKNSEVYNHDDLEDNSIGFSDFQCYFAERSGLFCLSSSVKDDTVDVNVIKEKKKNSNNNNTQDSERIQIINGRYKKNLTKFGNNKRKIRNPFVKNYANITKTSLTKRLTRSSSFLNNRSNQSVRNKCLKMKRKYTKKQKNLRNVGFLNNSIKIKNKESSKDSNEQKESMEFNQNETKDDDNEIFNKHICAEEKSNFVNNKHSETYKKKKNIKLRNIKNNTIQNSDKTKIEHITKKQNIPSKTDKSFSYKVADSKIKKEKKQQLSSQRNYLKSEHVEMENSDIFLENSDIEVNNIDKNEIYLQKRIQTRSCKLDTEKINSVFLTKKNKKYTAANNNTLCRKSLRLPLVCTVDHQILSENNDKAFLADFKKERSKFFNNSSFPVIEEENFLYRAITKENKSDNSDILIENHIDPAQLIVDADKKITNNYLSPKKLTEIIDENVENKESNMKLSYISSPKNNKGNIRCSSRTWNYSCPLSSSSHLNGKVDINSPRLIIRLRKDPNYPDYPRWQRETEFECQSVKRIDNSKEQISKAGRLQCSENKTVHSENIVPLHGSKEIGNRYMMRCRTH